MSRSTQSVEDDAAGGLSIGELERRTGVPGATLRTWESRYGAPAPTRLPGGHRRYSDTDVELVADIMRRRAAGQQLSTAVEAARAARELVQPSVFAALRHQYPRLRSHVLAKPRLFALTRAMEDECCARAEHPVLFACFQREDLYDQSRSRWEELARTARSATVLADFQRTRTGGQRPGPVLVGLAADAVLRREWVVVCDAPDYPACLAGWEIPGRADPPDGERLFETVLSVDPQVVRTAARTCAGLAAEHADTTAGVSVPDGLNEPVREGSADLHRAEGLFDRMLDYLAAERVPAGP